MELKPERPQLEPNYFRFQLNCLLILGVDIKPIENRYRRFLFRIYSFIFLGTFAYIFTTLEVLYVVYVEKEMNDLIFSLAFVVTHILGSIKIMYVMFNKQIFWKMLQKLETGVFRPSLDRGGAESFKLIKDANRLTKIHACFFYITACTVIALRSGSTMLHNTRTKYEFDDFTNTTNATSFRVLPYLTVVPFNVQKSPMYEIIFLYQVSSYATFGGYIGAIDALIYGCIMHTKVHFQILKKCVVHFGDYAKEKVSEKFPELNSYEKIENVRLPKGVERVELFNNLVLEEAEKRLTFCVYYHQKIIDWREQMEEEFRYLMLLQLLSNTYIACFQLYQLSVINPVKRTFDFFSMMAYWFLMMHQLFSYCWHGNEVIEESLSLSSHVFSSEWICTNERIKKHLLLIMMRSQRALYFTAGKFALLSFEMYSSILRASVSYFMILRQVNNK